MPRYIAIFAALALIGLRGCQKEPPHMTALAVTLLVRDNDANAIPGAKLRLIFGNTGADAVTDPTGHAKLAANAVIDRRWFWVNVGFTGLSVPKRMDNLAPVAELDHSVRIDERVVHFPVLYKMDIYRDSNGDCWNPGARVFGPDVNGQFIIDLDKRNKAIPLGGKMLMVPNNAYRATGSFDNRENPVPVDLEFLQERWAQAQ